MHAPITVHAEAAAEERAAARRLRSLAKARKARQDAARRRQRTAKQRLAEVEARMDALGEEYHLPDADRRAIRKELRDLGQERMTLLYGSDS